MRAGSIDSPIETRALLIEDDHPIYASACAGKKTHRVFHLYKRGVGEEPPSPTMSNIYP